MAKFNSEVALMEVNIGGFSSHSSLSLDRHKNENCFDLVVPSESPGQMLGFKNHDLYNSRVQTHGCLLLVNNRLKSYEMMKFFLKF